jgi:hypothetical protein
MKKVKLHNWLLIASRKSSTIIVLIQISPGQKSNYFLLAPIQIRPSSKKSKVYVMSTQK